MKFKEENRSLILRKRILALLLAAGILVTLPACVSMEPCENCGRTPTKGYRNDYTGENEYYCTSCSSDCTFCSNTATRHYTSALGLIIFVCEDCYADILEFNS